MLFKRHRLLARKYRDEYRCMINNDYHLEFYIDSKLLAKYKKDVEEGKSKYITFLDKEDKLKDKGFKMIRDKIDNITWEQLHDTFLKYYRNPEEVLEKEKELRKEGWIIHE